jgi:site-specific recombinase XerD
MKFSEAANIHLKEVQVIKAATTYKGAVGYLRRACEYLGNMECEDITKGVILDFIINRREKNPDLKNATINKYLKHIFATLSEEANIHINMKRLREDKTIPQILTDQTINTVYKYCDSLNSEEGIRNRLMFMMLYDTGMRISELLRMQVKDINLQSRMIHVTQTKNGFNRYTLFTEKTLEVFERFTLANRINKQIFINLETRTVLHPDSIQTICQRIQERAGITQSITPHKWRHTFASRFTDQDGNTFVLMKLLGHRDIQSTQRYVHVSMKKVIDEYSKIIGN